jgi:hypothetical protein
MMHLVTTVSYWGLYVIARSDEKEVSFSLTCPGANPTTVSYNASVVKIYNATSSLVRFGNKHILIYFEKRSSLLQC